MPTTSPLKRPSAGGRLGRLLASLRPPARAGPLPVQTGFPTSLADLVVKNHGRLRHPRQRHRPPTTAAPSPPAPPSVAAAQPLPPAQEQRREALTVQNQSAVARRRRKDSAFCIRPEVLAVGGAVALALLLVWSKWLVAVATVASVALVWMESAASRRRPRPETMDVLVLSGRGVVSPIREEAETPRSSCADSDTGSDEVSSVWAGADTAELASEGDDSNSIAPRSKEKRRSLRKLIAKKLRKNGKRSAKEEEDTDTGSLHGGESNHSDAGEAGVNAGPVPITEPALPAPSVDATPPEAITGERCREGGAFPSAAFVPIILVGLVAGKVPAVALTVLCAVFFSSVDRVPAS